MTRTLRINDHDFRLLYPRRVIEARVAAMAEKIDDDFKGQEVLFVGIMNGSFVFAADLLRKLKLRATISFVRMASYKGQESTGQVRSLIGLNEEIENRNVILLEDIVETGHTIRTVQKQLLDMKPAQLAVATLLFKPQSCLYPLLLDYVGFEIDDRFVIGYGLDYDGYGRNFDSIYVMI